MPEHQEIPEEIYDEAEMIKAIAQDAAEFFGREETEPIDYEYAEQSLAVASKVDPAGIKKKIHEQAEEIRSQREGREYIDKFREVAREYFGQYREKIDTITKVIISRADELPQVDVAEELLTKLMEIYQEVYQKMRQDARIEEILQADGRFEQLLNNQAILRQVRKVFGRLLPEWADKVQRTNRIANLIDHKESKEDIGLN